jgi:hypothetical protein
MYTSVVSLSPKYIVDPMITAEMFEAGIDAYAYGDDSLEDSAAIVPCHGCNQTLAKAG